MPSHAKSQDVSPGVQKIGSHGLPLQGNSENVISRWAADTWYEGTLHVVPLLSGLLELSGIPLPIFIGRANRLSLLAWARSSAPHWPGAG